MNIESCYIYEFIHKSGNVEQFVEYVSKLKENNPDVEIALRTIKNNEEEKILVVTSSKPIDDLLTSETSRVIFFDYFKRINSETYREKIKDVLIDYEIDEYPVKYFADKLKKLNPTAKIDYIYDVEKKIGKIISDCPLTELKYEKENRTLTFDKDGYVGFINREACIYEYKDRSEYYVPHYDHISYEEITKIKEEQSRLEEEKIRIDTALEKDRRSFKILNIEKDMNDAKKAKNSAALLAGLTGLFAMASIVLRDTSIIPQNLLESWESLCRILQDFGPITTASLYGLGISLIKHKIAKEKFNQASQQYDSLKESETMGGNENVRTR